MTFPALAFEESSSCAERIFERERERERESSPGGIVD